MRELALHLLDIAENSIAAQAKTIRINVERKTARRRLAGGKGGDDGASGWMRTARVIDPFYTSG